MYLFNAQENFELINQLALHDVYYSPSLKKWGYTGFAMSFHDSVEFCDCKICLITFMFMVLLKWNLYYTCFWLGHKTPNPNKF